VQIGQVARFNGLVARSTQIKTLARLPRCHRAASLLNCTALANGIENSVLLGAVTPLCFLALFIAASFLMIWRLECMTENGMEGTVLGTLIMPYCSGLGNLIFAFLVGVNGAADVTEVVTNALVNNITNVTLLIGLPALLWGARLAAGPQPPKSVTPEPHRSARSDLLLTLTVVFVFTGVTWLLARDGRLGFEDGLVLVGLFLFWQAYYLFEVLHGTVETRRSSLWPFVLDLVLLAVGAYGVYVSIEWLVNWIVPRVEGVLSAQYLGWLSGWLMVVPNALLALYYGYKRRADILYSSQVGDGHICIPLCLGVVALYRPLEMPPNFGSGITIIVSTTALHFLCVAFAGGLARWIGAILVVAYAGFVYSGFAK